MTGEARAAKPRVVVMGVSGCGKTTIGGLVAHELGVPFLDGDSLHPMENVAKMAAGTPLTDTVFLHLHGSKEVLRQRLEGRSGHFMPPALLDSQLATLEPLRADERGVVVDIAAPVNEVVDGAVSVVSASAFRVPAPPHE